MRRIMFISIITTFIFTVGVTLDILAYEKEIRSLSSNIAENIVKAGKKTIAVVDFVDLQGNVTELGRFLAEEFSIALAAAGRGFEVVDRTHLKSILAEHKLSATGIIDPQTARKLGQIAGVDALVTGTITPFGDSIRVSVKILDTATAKVIGASSGDIAKTKAIEELLGKGIETGTAETQRTPSGPPSLGKGIEVEGVLFKPMKCWRSGRDTICTVTFINNGREERKLHIWGKRGPINRPYSNVYDNLGNQYSVDIQIGSHRYNPLNEKFIPGLPVNVNFVAVDVRPEATSMSVTIGIEEIKRPIAIRNIPITK